MSDKSSYTPVDMTKLLDTMVSLGKETEKKIMNDVTKQMSPILKTLNELKSENVRLRETLESYHEKVDKDSDVMSRLVDENGALKSILTTIQKFLSTEVATTADVGVVAAKVEGVAAKVEGVAAKVELIRTISVKGFEGTATDIEALNAQLMQEMRYCNQNFMTIDDNIQHLVDIVT